MEKYKLNGYSAISLHEKIPTHIKDDSDADLFLLDTVIDDANEKHGVFF